MKRWGSPERDALRVLAETDSAGAGARFARGVLVAYGLAGAVYGGTALFVLAVTR